MIPMKKYKIIILVVLLLILAVVGGFMSYYLKPKPQHEFSYASLFILGTRSNFIVKVDNSMYTQHGIPPAVWWYDLGRIHTQDAEMIRLSESEYSELIELTNEAYQVKPYRNFENMLLFGFTSVELCIDEKVYYHDISNFNIDERTASLVNFLTDKVEYLKKPFP